MSCSLWHLGTSVGDRGSPVGRGQRGRLTPLTRRTNNEFGGSTLPTATRRLCLPRLVQGTEGSLEFGGNLVQGWGNGR
jgi:hypothetical protein